MKKIDSFILLEGIQKELLIKHDKINETKYLKSTLTLSDKILKKIKN